MSRNPELLERESKLEDIAWEWAALWYAVQEIETGFLAAPGTVVAKYLHRKRLIRDKFYEDHPCR